MSQSKKVTVPGRASRGIVAAIRRLVSDFLAIAGLVAVVLGLLYRFTPPYIPHLLQEHGHSAPSPSRSSYFLVAGAASILLARLIRPRRRSLGVLPA